MRQQAHPLQPPRAAWPQATRRPTPDQASNAPARGSGWSGRRLPKNCGSQRSAPRIRGPGRQASQTGGCRRAGAGRAGAGAAPGAAAGRGPEPEGHGGNSKGAVWASGQSGERNRGSPAQPSSRGGRVPQGISQAASKVFTLARAIAKSPCLSPLTSAVSTPLAKRSSPATPENGCATMKLKR